MADSNLRLIPRVCGRVGEIVDPVELRGRFTFEVFIGFIGHGEPEKIFNGPDYATESEAKTALLEASRLVCKKIEESFGVDAGKFIDLKDNRLKSWDDTIKGSGN